MLEIKNIPLTILNRALELFGEAHERDKATAMRALQSAESRISVVNGGVSPFAKALAEHIDSGEGYKLDISETIVRSRKAFT